MNEFNGKRSLPLDMLSAAHVAPSGVVLHPTTMDKGQVETRTASPIDIVRRRWRLMLYVWLAVAVPCVPCVWLYFGSEYTSTGIIRVAPFIPRILFRDEDSGLLPLYGAFVTTQIELITSPIVLSETLKEQGVKDLPWVVNNPDPVGYLLQKLKVENPTNTELITVSMQDSKPAELAPVVNAVLNAYMETVVEEDQEGDLAKLELLYKKQADLETELKSRHDELYKLATEFGTISLGNRQDLTFECVQEFQVQLRRAQVGRVASEARIRALKDYMSVEVTPAEIEQLKQELFVADPELTSLIQAKVHTTQALGETSQEFGSQHPALGTLRQRREGLTDQIRQRMEAITQSLPSQAQQRVQVEFTTKLREEKQRLAEATQTEKVLQDVVREEIAQLTNLGKSAVQLEALREKIDQSKRLYDAVLQRIQHIEVERQRPARISIASHAREPTAPTNDRRPKLTTLVIAGALFLATVCAVLVDSRDTAVRCDADVQHHLGLPVLGRRSLANGRKAIGNVNGESDTEEIRGIRGSVLFASSANGCRSVLITSPNPGEGKTRVAGELARALADSGRRVLLVDADNRKQDLTRQFGHEGRPGLSDVLANSCDLSEVFLATDTDRLTLLPSGSRCDEFTELLVRPGALERIGTCFTNHDHVIIDSPPVLQSTESGVWAGHVDAVLMVLRANESAREDAVAAKEHLCQMGGRVMGTVLNGIVPRGPYYRYRHSHREAHKTGPGQGAA